MLEKIYKFLKIRSKISFSLDKKWFSSLDNLSNNTLCFVSDINSKNISKINKKKKLVLLIKKKNLKINKNIVQIETYDPKLIFFEILKKLHKPIILNNKPIIGKNTKILNNVNLGKNVIIGNNTIIMPNVVINDDVQIGNNCIIKSGSIIGQKGFQAIKDKNKNLITIFHVGKVVIKDFVDIGALNTIARGTIDATFIDSYNKFDDHVHVAHNDHFGKNNKICAATIFGGSVKIGMNNFFGLNSTIRDTISIGNNNYIGQNSNVVKDIHNDQLVYGNPAK
jgi:UDP-3-O-[3-hydroxymyristoyl] glucosamine N-acyltransferase